MAKEVEVTATTMQIDVIYGPYAGGRVRVSVEEGKLAISEGWARDAYPSPRQKPVEPTLTTPTELTTAAEAAAIRWRSAAEPEPTGDVAAQQPAASAEVEADAEETETEVEEEIVADETEVEEEVVEADDEVDPDGSSEASPPGTYQTRRGGRPKKRK